MIILHSQTCLCTISLGHIPTALPFCLLTLRCAWFMSFLCGMVTVTGHPFFRTHLQSTTRSVIHPWERRIPTLKFGVKIHRNIVVIDLNLLGLFFLANIFFTSPRSLFFFYPGVRLEETCEQAPGERSVTRREAARVSVYLIWFTPIHDTRIWFHVNRRLYIFYYRGKEISAVSS